MLGRIWRWIRWPIWVAAGLSAVVAAWLLFRLWSPLPQRTGTVVLAGIGAPVEVLRDEHGIPHIRARTEADALFGLGYVHAQDRLWQMEFQRRLAAGRLAEIAGPAALPADRLFRTLGLRRVASQNVEGLGQPARALIDAYTRGVNAFLAAHHGRSLPVEFGVFRIEPEPWTAEDVLAFSKVMAFGLSTNWRDELLRARIAARVGVDGAEALMPPYTANGPIILPEGVQPEDAAPASVTPAARAASPRPPTPGARDDTLLAATWLARVAALAAGSLAVPDVATGIAASNNWVVSGARATSGRPMLANDPHLAAQAPSLWYLAHVSGGRLDAIGGSIPGLPGIVLGHNARIAWGATNLMADVQDLFVERLNAHGEALYQGSWVPMTTLRETIRVRNGPDQVLVVRTTRHGPIVSDVLPGLTDALALRWTALDTEDRTVEAFLALNVAGSWGEFSDAIGRVHAPSQNFVYADVDGNIGYFAPGALPVRPAHDGTLPVPGWSGEFDWAGDVPSSAWPRIFNPTRGYIATANNQALPDEAPYAISTNWEPGYRAERIAEQLEATARHDTDSFARMQADVRSLEAKLVVPWLQRARPADDASRAAMARLRQWDGTLAAESADAAIYEAWTDAVERRLFAGRLGPDLWAEYAQLAPWRAKALNRIVAHADDSWCDDVTTGAVESCEDTLGAALADALRDLAATEGTADPGRWQWGRANQMWFPHVPLHAAGPLRWVFSRHAAPGGDRETVRPVVRVRDQVVIASYRQIVDLANLDASRFVLPLGQSGQLLSGHYDDLLPRWVGQGYLPMRFSHAAVDAATRNRLVLQPAAASR